MKAPQSIIVIIPAREKPDKIKPPWVRVMFRLSIKLGIMGPHSELIPKVENVAAVNNPIISHLYLLEFLSTMLFCSVFIFLIHKLHTMLFNMDYHQHSFQDFSRYNIWALGGIDD